MPDKEKCEWVRKGGPGERTAGMQASILTAKYPQNIADSASFNPFPLALANEGLVCRCFMKADGLARGQCKGALDKLGRLSLI